MLYSANFCAIMGVEKGDKRHETIKRQSCGRSGKATRKN
jgi:hypothetical protein